MWTEFIHSYVRKKKENFEYMLLIFTAGKLSTLPSWILEVTKQPTTFSSAVISVAFNICKCYDRINLECSAQNGTMPLQHTFPEVQNSTHQILKADRYKYLNSGVFVSRCLSSYEQYSVHGALYLSAPYTHIHEHIFNLWVKSYWQMEASFLRNIQRTVDRIAFPFSLGNAGISKSGPFRIIFGNFLSFHAGKSGII